MFCETVCFEQNKFNNMKNQKNTTLWEHFSNLVETNYLSPVVFAGPLFCQLFNVS